MLTLIRKLRELRRNERLSRSEFEAAKLEKFRSLIRYVRPRSPFYARVIDERNIDLERCTPADFPELTKSTLMAHFDAIVTEPRVTRDAVTEFLARSSDPNDRLFGRYRVLHTSGSSGEVGYFVFAEEDWQRGMAQSLRPPRQPAPRKRRFRRLRVAFYGATGGHFAGVSMISAAKRGLGRLFVRVETYEINSPLAGVVTRLNAFRPDLLTGYTTGLKVLAEKQREGVLRIAPFEVLTTGEAMSPGDRQFLEGAFGCPANNGYGSSEHLVMGGANRDGESMTLFEDDLIYDFHEDHTLVTNLFNRTLPLVRYRMTDVLRPMPASAPQSKAEAPYTVIHSLLGRAEETPWFLNHDGVPDFIHPISVVELFFRGVTRFQMRVHDRLHFQFRVVLDSTLADAERYAAVAGVERRLRELLDQKRMTSVTFDVVPVADLAPNPRTGKFQLIVHEEGARRANPATTTHLAEARAEE